MKIGISRFYGGSSLNGMDIADRIGFVGTPLWWPLAISVVASILCFWKV
ncbi:hypothetical protein [Candidatus Puniceispirillum sp.]